MSEESEALDNPPAEAAAATPLIQRDEKGRFIKGHSGHPAGRTKGRKNRIKELQTLHELALREYIADPERQDKVMESLDNLFRIAGGGTEDHPVENNHAVSAAKLIFDRLMPKASPGEDKGAQAPSAVQVTIVNNDGEHGAGIQQGVTIEMADPEDE